MKSSLTIPRVVFYPFLTVFAITCWYIGYSQGQAAIPLGFEVVELPACMPEPRPQATYL